MSNIFDESVGLLREAIVVGYDDSTKKIKIQLENSSFSKGNSTAFDISLPNSLSFNDGTFIGGEPTKGSKIVVGQGSGNKYYYVSSIVDTLKAPSLSKEIKIQTSDFSKISLNKNLDILIGSDNNNISLNSKQFYSNTLDNQYSFSQASVKIDGLIKREKNYQQNISDQLKYKDSKYYLSKQSIGLDPNSSTNNLSETFNKNPPFVESRKVVYEFQELSNVQDDSIESGFYKNQKEVKNYSYPDRRKLRSNVLNLSQNNPNYLIEKIEGTVIDIFGNVLDINRYPINFENNTFIDENSNDKSATFFKIKELQRKGIAYHFELNSKKNITSPPDVNIFSDYSKSRSRFFIDIDKEGQLKANIPSSSETGNVSLHTRYENYSHVSTDDNQNPNKLIWREDMLDIVHDSFGNGQISIMSDNSEVSPLDRKTGSNIKYGTVYHNILDVCKTHQSLNFINYQNDETIKLDNSYVYTNFLQKTIITSGPNANAGGRSINLNLDGSMDLNIGANTSDRQSIILDTAGGIVGSIGRDKNNHSALLNMDGNLLLQIGGYGVSTDSRFDKLQNGYLDGVLDIRVLRPGYQATMFRIDKEGVKVLTAGRMMFHANGDMILKSDSTMTIEAENLIANGRMILKESGGSI